MEVEDGDRSRRSAEVTVVDLGTEFRSKQRRETRATTLIGGLVALAALPAWALFDHVLAGGMSSSFLRVRLACELAIAVCCAALWWRRLGERWSEALSLTVVAILEIAIAWMVPRSGHQLQAYLLGLSLPIYATAFLLVWRWRMTLALVAITGAALALSMIRVEPGPDARQVTTIVFYLSTASAMAVAAQIYRERKSRQEHRTLAALEAERHRNRVLVTELEQLSCEDPLTALGNRRAWDQRLTHDFLLARRNGTPLSIILCDLDRFKEVNDRDGHSVGDSVLRSAAAVLARRARPGDFVARLGGDEFAILCPNTSLAAAAETAVEILDLLPNETRLPTGKAVTCSIGVAELDRWDGTTASLYHRADAALYSAKATRDSVRCAEPGRSNTTRPQGRTSADARADENRSLG
ncbi:hypothetical protein BH10ACT1_BH10ACT1_04490 [soil metagenome]